MEKKKKYYDLLANKEEKTTHLGLTVYGLIFLCVVFLIIMLKISTAPRPIYYITGTSPSGVAFPNQIPAEAITSFAVSYTMTRANFNPSTIKSVLEASYKYLDSQFRAEQSAQENYLCEQVDRTSLSQSFSITAEPALKEIAGGYEIIITGEESKYSGKSLASSEKVSYRVVVKKVVPTDINKYGLAISEITKEGSP